MEGNQMKMREALELCAHEMCKYCRKAAVVENLVIPCLEGCETLRIAKEALALPRRNCDVGTAEEQAERYHAIGEVYHTLTLTNALEWAQMPYAEEGGES